MNEQELDPKHYGSRLVTWQHDDTGYIFTKEIPAGEPIPTFPRRTIVKIEEP